MRLLLLVLFFCLAATATTARAQTPPPCGGHFERFLKGYSIGPWELKAFFEDRTRIAVCRKQLDANDIEHVLIAGLIEMEARDDPAAAGRHFAAACARGSVLGCAWEVAADLKAQKPAPNNARIGRNFHMLVEHGLPMVDTRIGTAWIHEFLEQKRDLEPALRFLRRAADAGDFNAMRSVIIFTSRSGSERRSEAESQALTAKLGELGYTPAFLELAHESLSEKRLHRRDPSAALPWFRRAADADPRFFQHEIAAANYRLATMLRAGDGTAPDPAEADRRLQRAAALGHRDARKELHERTALQKK